MDAANVAQILPFEDRGLIVSNVNMRFMVASGRGWLTVTLNLPTAF